MKQSTAYRIAILAVTKADICANDKIDVLKVLFQALHFAEKREEGNNE